MSEIEAKACVVIRPDFVWDTRAPLFAFNELNRQENQTYYALLLGIEKLCEHIGELEPSLAASEFFNSKIGGPVARRSWRSFALSQHQVAQGKRYQPSVRDMRRLLKTSCIPAVTEYAIVSHYGLFESFMQCWVLNFLLAKLETGLAWNPSEARLASSFWPISSHIPGFPEIQQAIPIVREILIALPHVWEDPVTGEEIKEPVTSNLNAFTAINFWREWRNLLVHGSGLVNEKFAKKHEQFWKDFKLLYPHIRDFKSGQQLWLNDSTFRPVTTTHDRAAKSLRNILVDISKGHRGHAHAPGPPKEGWYPRSELSAEGPPPLLLVGDHDLSYQWATDEQSKRRMKPALEETFKKLREPRRKTTAARN